MQVLVTGAAGFIGFHVCQTLLQTPGVQVVGMDNINAYYEVELKHARLAELTGEKRFRFVQLDLADSAGMLRLVEEVRPDYVIHLAAQAGVRYSIDQPQAYVQSNVVGFVSLLEACRQFRPKHIVYASSSSVYGANSKTPFAETETADQPVSFYAATKRANELMAHSYAHIHGLPLTGLRFFTVYGPWGRPDMTPIIFARAIRGGKTLKLFNNGLNLRDFTYVADIVDGVIKLMYHVPEAAPGKPPCRVFNIGHNHPIEMVEFVQKLEAALGSQAKVELAPPQPGDMLATCADLTRIHDAVGYEPKVSLEEGLCRFVAWFDQYHDANGMPKA